MKNLLKEKNNRSKIIAIFVLLLFIVVYACERELSDLPSGNEEAQAIEKAKAWYEANKPVETLLRSSDGKNKMSMSPVWKNAYTMKNDKYEMIETDLMSYGRILYLDEACVKKYEETQNPYYRQCYTHLVFRINRATKDTVGFLMTMVPNVEWLEKSKFSPFLESSYLYRAKQYGGLILYHNMDGSFSNGWRYEKGKIVAAICSLSDDSNQFIFRSTTCSSIPIYNTYQNCVEVYYGGELCGPAKCTDVTTVVGFYMECIDWDLDSGNNGGNPPTGGGYTGGGSGGGSGNGDPTNSGKAPGARTDCGSSNSAANSTAANTVLNSDKGGAAQVKSNMDLMRGYAKTQSNEYGASINYTPANGYTVNQNSNGSFFNIGTASSVTNYIDNNTYMVCHTHPKGTDPNNPGCTAPSPKDVMNVVDAYSSGKRITASVIFGYDGSEYMIYVDNPGKLGAFTNDGTKLFGFIESNGDAFKDQPYLGEFNDARDALLRLGYTLNDALSYALTHVLDTYDMGIKISQKKNGEFKEQKNNNNSPQICP